MQQTLQSAEIETRVFQVPAQRVEIIHIWNKNWETHVSHWRSPAIQHDLASGFIRGESKGILSSHLLGSGNDIMNEIEGPFESHSQSGQANKEPLPRSHSDDISFLVHGLVDSHLLSRERFLSDAKELCETIPREKIKSVIQISTNKTPIERPIIIAAVSWLGTDPQGRKGRRGRQTNSRGIVT